MTGSGAHPPDDPFAALQAFWSALATERERVAGGLGLASPPVPLLFANGVWSADPARLAEAGGWCASQGAPAAVILREGDALPGLGGAARDAGALRLEPAPPPGAEARDPGRPALEEISWAHTRPLAELFGRRLDRLDLEKPFAELLTRALEREERLRAFLAYGDDGPLAGGVVLEHDDLVLAWLEGSARDALAAQLAEAGAGGRLRLLEALPAGAGERGHVRRWELPSG